MESKKYPNKQNNIYKFITKLNQNPLLTTLTGFIRIKFSKSSSCGADINNTVTVGEGPETRDMRPCGMVYKLPCTKAKR